MRIPIGSMGSALGVMFSAMALCGPAPAAVGTGMGSTPNIEVSLDSRGSVPVNLIWLAETGSAKIFQRVGLRLVWMSSKGTGSPGCRCRISVTIVDEAPDGIRGDVLAHSDLATGLITVFYDRIESRIRVWPRLGPVLLSNVLAHEIAHVLQSIDRHSDTGILKPHWTLDDLHLMITERLTFTMLDTALIRVGATGPCPHLKQSGD
jgi:hypothetical protein